MRRASSNGIRFLVIALALGAATQPAWSGEADVWLVSTRSAPTRGALCSGEERIGYWRLGADGCWETRDAEAFHAAADPSVPMTFFVHGNQTTANEAVREAWPLGRCLQREADGRPYRLVIWSWPSDRIRGRVRHDVRVKAARSDAQAYYLAQTLRRLPRDVPVNLVGYSFGSRIITGALHLAAGGRLAGRQLPGATIDRMPVRAVLVAAALDSDWLLPGRRNGLALSQVERMLITVNHRDRVLRWYPAMRRGRGPWAMGEVGPRVGRGAEKIERLNVTQAVGRRHDWCRYIASGCLRAAIGGYLRDQDAPPSAAGTHGGA